MTVRYYCVKLMDDNEVICIRADEMCKENPEKYVFKLDGEVVAEILDQIRAWWIEKRDEA